MKNIRILLYAVSMLMLSGCSDGIGTSMTKIFNVTCSAYVTGEGYGELPNWNVIFPPAFDKSFYVFKGIVKDGQIDCAEETTVYRYYSNSSLHNYADLRYAVIDSFYTYKTDTLYLSPDDDENYALLVWSYSVNSDGKISSNTQSDFFYPKDLIAIKCFTWSSSSKEYSWTIEFSERPDSLYFVQFTYSGWANKKAYYKKLPNYYINYYEKIDLDSTNFIHDTSTGSYSAGSSFGYTVLFARYGDYYVRVSPILL